MTQWSDSRRAYPAIRDLDMEVITPLITPLGQEPGTPDPDKYLGCLLGGAAGDALGYTVEFEQEEQIFRRYGPEGITRFDLVGGLGRISDDTQMTLFTACGLLAAGPHRLSYPEALAKAYKDWITTQYAGRVRRTRKKLCWLMNDRRLYAARAPGSTCLSAIEAGAWGKPETPINNSKGCGGVMRVAPVGLYPQDLPLPARDLLAADAAAVTHGHELGYIPGAMLAHIVYLASHRDNLSLEDIILDAREAMVRLFADCGHLDGLLALVDRALELAGSDRPDLDCIHDLGEGWVAEETLAIAIFCALRHRDDFGKALTASVNHKGDSDSTGAVTGNILGAYAGRSAIPSRFLDKLELEDVLTIMGEDLYAGEQADMAREKYRTVTFIPEHRNG